MATPKTGNPVGRPPYYKTPEEMETKINAFFDEFLEPKPTTFIDKRGNACTANIVEPVLWSELLMYLGLAAYNGPSRYKKKPEFVKVLTYAKQRIKGYWVKKAATGQLDTKMATRYLSVEHDMVEKQQIDHNVTGTITHEPSPAMLGMINAGVKQVGHNNADGAGEEVVDGEVEE